MESSDRNCDVNVPEVEDRVTSSNVREKPLSPILNGSLNNRKFFMGRKLNKKRNVRVKLSDRFKENDKEKQLLVTPVNVIDQLDLVDSLSASQSKALIDHLDKLEELENSRKNIYEKLVRNNKNNTDILIQTNKSSASSECKESKIDVTNRNGIYNTSTENKYFQEIQLDQIRPSSTKDLSVGFHTATGRNISISDSDLKKCTKLFGDIIYPSQHCSEGRQNKYSFLKKKKTHDLKSNISFKLNKSLKCSKSTSNISEKGKHFFADEDFGDIYLNTAHDGFKKACLAISSHQEAPTKLKNSIKINKNNDGISLTQAIHESEISNTQMVNAVDDILLSIENNKEDFKGFSKFEIKESLAKLEDLQKLIENKFTVTEFSNCNNCHKYSKSIQPCNLSRKRPRKLDQFRSNADCNQNNLLKTSNNSSGFHSASGKLITLSEKSIRRAGVIFDDMDFHPPQPKKFKTEILDANINEDPAKINSLQGFQKASGKLVSISDSSLQKAKGLFGLDRENLHELASKSDIPQEKRRNSINKNHFPLCAKDMKIKNKNEDYFEDSIPNCGDFGPKNCKALGATGFCKASGKTIKVSNTALKKAKCLFETMDLENCEEELHKNPKFEKIAAHSQSDISQEVRKKLIPKNSLPSSAKGVKCKNIKKENYLQNSDQDFIPACSNIRPENFNATNSFCKASGKVIEVSNAAVEKAKSLFDNLDMENDEENIHEKSVNSEKTPATNKSNIFQQKRRNFNSKISIPSSTKDMKSKNQTEDHCPDFNHHPIPTNFQPENVNAISAKGFRKASGTVVEVSNTAIKKAESILDNLSMDSLHEDDQTLVNPNSTLEQIENGRMSKHTNYSSHLSVCTENISTDVPVEKESLILETTPVSIRSKLGARSNKKKLGISHFKQIHTIGENKLDKAKLLFDEDFSKISPMKPLQSIAYTSTPIKQTEKCSVPNTNTLRPKSFSKMLEAADITPIKTKNNDNKQEHFQFNSNLAIQCVSPTKDDWLEKLAAERKKVELRLNVLTEREKLGEKMMVSLKMGKSIEDKRPREGILYKMKTTRYKTSLINFVNREKPGCISSANNIPINPKNAENLHFKEQLSGSILTEDKAVVIPNSKDMVGLSEIKNAFEFMPGIEQRLIPSGWVKNHYKWIVWKLASYENRFPRYFSGCLNIENIIQQLKYRYDREIDKAERSPLRRICEKDDAPQKRMILLVSDIKMSDVGKYELELCDGWYAVRTIIDEPLCNHINNGKIQIGTKLLISGAELLNCDGCHPLEVTNLVCLNINCNSTRRAIWHAKLGFQRNPNPFPIQLQSIHPLGGSIGAIRVCIVRVYPFKYMEKLQGRTVWRNRKADEIAAQKWENERSKKLEQIQEEVSKKFENSCNKSPTQTFIDSDVSSITCPKTLHEIMKKSNDPECFQENLSTSQKAAVFYYQNNLSMKKQMEMAAEVRAGVSKMKLSKRDVTAVLKILVIDSIGDSDKPCNFTIWRPTELHLQTLKEGKSFIIQNVLPRPNGDLNSTAKTTFKLEQNNDKCVKYNRTLMQLSELSTRKAVPYFNEFDTVGLVVQIKIQSRMQEAWITDNAGRLLFITIYEGSDTCSLLENVKRGHATTVCNLIYRGLKKNILQAVANHYTVFSSYSQHKHLQEGLDLFKKEISKDIPNLLNDCDTKIEVFKIVSDINSFSENFEEPE